jgi:ribonucleoside-diphosphate reductase alpha chain
MDYIFRWIQMRFLSGTQLDLFAGLQPAASVPVQGQVTAPANTVVPSAHSQYPKQGVILSEALSERSDPKGGVEGPAVAFGDAESVYDRTPPRGGIAPDLQARSGLTDNGQLRTDNFEDRGIYHTASAMRSMVDMGDSPSCATCGAIMTRNGSCYRCNECGSTSGCS